MTDKHASGGLSTKQARKLLHQALPSVFADRGQPKRPLSINIHRGLLEHVHALGVTEMTGGALSRAIADYCSGASYLRELQCGARRIDSTGRTAGYVTQWDQDDAERKLRRMNLSFHLLSVEALVTAKAAA